MDNMVVAMWFGIKGWSSFDVCVFIYIWIVYVYYTVSSPYLLAFGDDRIRGTREQMMLQVDLVRYKAGAWASLGNFL